MNNFDQIKNALQRIRHFNDLPDEIQQGIAAINLQGGIYRGNGDFGIGQVILHVLMEIAVHTATGDLSRCPIHFRQNGDNTHRLEYIVIGRVQHAQRG